MQPKHIRTDIKEGVLIVTVLDSKMNDFDRVGEMELEIRKAVAACDSPNLVLDMGNVEMLTSVALLPLVGLKKLTENRGGAVILCNLNEPVAQALTITQLIVESREHARYLQMANCVADAIRQVCAQHS